MFIWIELKEYFEERRINVNNFVTMPSYFGDISIIDLKRNDLRISVWICYFKLQMEGASMKRVLVILGTIGILGLIVFTLVNNKQQRDMKANWKRGNAFPVMTTVIKKQSLEDQLSQVGVIVADNDVSVASELQGKVIQVFVKEGSFVAAGAPIVKLEDTVQEANFVAAQNNYMKAQKDLERYTSLHDEQLVSDTQLESMRLACKSAEAQYIAAQKQYNNAMVTSPISGVVTSRPVDLGSMVNIGTVVAEVVDTSQFKVQLNVDETNAFRLKTGDSVLIETDVYPGAKLYGRIDNISAKGDQAHTFPIQVVIPNNNRQYPLKSGMFGRLTFNLGKQEGLIVPRDALVSSIKNPQIYVVHGATAKLKTITVSSENGTNLVVTDGLNEGDAVVISGQENLTDNAKVLVLQPNGGNSGWSGKGGKWPGNGSGWSGKTGKNWSGNKSGWSGKKNWSGNGDGSSKNKWQH